VLTCFCISLERGGCPAPTVLPAYERKGVSLAGLTRAEYKSGWFALFQRSSTQTGNGGGALPNTGTPIRQWRCALLLNTTGEKINGVGTTASSLTPGFTIRCGFLCAREQHHSGNTGLGLVRSLQSTVLQSPRRGTLRKQRHGAEHDRAVYRSVQHPRQP